jgi:hypothetical protein
MTRSPAGRVGTGHRRLLPRHIQPLRMGWAPCLLDCHPWDGCDLDGASPRIPDAGLAPSRPGPRRPGIARLACMTLPGESARPRPGRRRAPGTGGWSPWRRRGSSGVSPIVRTCRGGRLTNGGQGSGMTAARPEGGRRMTMRAAKSRPLPEIIGTRARRLIHLTSAANLGRPSIRATRIPITPRRGVVRVVARRSRANRGGRERPDWRHPRGLSRPESVAGADHARPPRSCSPLPGGATVV